MSATAAIRLGPRLYRGLQRVFAPGAETALPAQLDALLAGWRPTGPALDVGCGDASMLVRLGFAPVLGLDTAHDRLLAFADTARRMPGDCIALHGAALRADAMRLPLRDGACGLVLCCGLLHHLPDSAATRALSEMRRVLAPGGRLVVFDAVLPERPGRRPVAAAIRALDRGRFMRSQRTLQALVLGSNPGLDWRVRRTSYAGTGLEGLWCIASSPYADRP